MRLWLSKLFLNWSLWLMGDCQVRRLLLWHMDECCKQFESPEWAERMEQES